MCVLSVIAMPERIYKKKKKKVKSNSGVLINIADIKHEPLKSTVLSECEKK